MVVSAYVQNCPNSAFLDTAEIYRNGDDEHLIDLLLSAAESQKIITGDMVVSMENMAGLADIVSSAKILQKDENFPFSRLVIPVTISPYGPEQTRKEAHGVAVCIDYDKGKKCTDIVILEQHARKDGTKLDFSSEVACLHDYLKGEYEQEGEALRTFCNGEPICREERVCGIVSLEMCKRLLEADNPYEFVQNPQNIRLDLEDVKNLHAQNIEIANPEIR